MCFLYVCVALEGWVSGGLAYPHDDHTQVCCAVLGRLQLEHLEKTNTPGYTLRKPRGKRQSPVCRLKHRPYACDSSTTLTIG